jgi:hypothetical protein
MVDEEFKVAVPRGGSVESENSACVIAPYVEQWSVIEWVKEQRFVVSLGARKDNDRRQRK